MLVNVVNPALDKMNRRFLELGGLQFDLYTDDSLRRLSSVSIMPHFV
jgi:hypothetical protein